MHLIVKSLATTDAARAFPLIQAHDNRCTLDQWQRFVRALTTPDNAPDGEAPGGTIVATDSLDYIHGLFTYRVTPHLTSGRTLQIEHFVPFEGLTTKGVARILLSEVEPLARRLACHSVSIDVPAQRFPVAEPTHPALPLLDATGHRLASARLIRTF
ncbi:MAG: hypothetical protein ACTSX7_14835 [Alphaproteobacteria bacterium]